MFRARTTWRCPRPSVRGPLLAVFGLLSLSSCVEEAPPEPLLRIDGRRGSAGEIAGETADTWTFADGTTLRALELPQGATPPGTVRVAFETSAPGVFEVTLAPPRTTARQVAKGGPDAPPQTVPEDPRTRRARARASGPGRVEVAVELPPPWHPKTAIVSVTRIVAGRVVSVVTGPRRDDGVGLLGVLRVASEPTAVRGRKVAATPSIDGVLEEPVWGNAEWTALHGSLDGEPVRLGAAREDAPSLGSTEVAFGWDDAALYVGARLPDADIRGTFERDDDPIWKEEVFEVFVFGDDRRARYLELQVSPRGVRFDARFEQYRKGDEAWNSRFETGVHVEGTVEDASDVDRGWTAELRIPWDEICEHTEVVCPPRAGDSLRLGAFRLERPRRGPTVGLALSPTRVPDFHAPQNAAVLHLLP